MQKEEFLQMLARERFSQIVTVTREANGFLDTHSHPFESKALILSGEIAMHADGTDTLYRPGDIFRLRLNQEHTERYGPAGVTYLVGRK